MIDVDTYELAMGLAKCESEDEVVDHLRRAGLWSDDDVWRDFGGLPNNFGTIGNQQSDPRGALVEKLVNSVDALLLRECLRRRIDPRGPGAPATMEAASQQFFGVSSGNLALLTNKDRTAIAEETACLVVSGAKPPGNPTISVIDKGEGQEPANFVNTFLALHRSNKESIPFVQGKFHMGGTGVLPYSSPRHNLQFLISRRDPELSPTDRAWGFTIVRRRRPQGATGLSKYEYLAPEGQVLRVATDRLPIWPTEDPQKWSDATFGTMIRLFEYQIPERTMATTDLYRALSRRLFRMVLPIRMFEHRAYQGHTLSSTLAGMTVRLEEDPASVLEPGFPSAGDLSIPDVGNIRIVIALLKKGEETSRWLKARESIIFTINGQAHAFLPKDFFGRSSVNLKWVASDLLVEVDCSRLPASVVEQIFMPSRDRMRESNEQSQIESSLEDFLKHHPGLREWNEKRHAEAVRQTVESDEHTRNLLEELVSANREVAALLFPGMRLSDPTRRGVDTEQYRGHRFPKFLRLANVKARPHVKRCPTNSYCRVEFETDVDNDYFIRASEPGDLIISRGATVLGKSLWNGVLTLTLQPVKGARIGEQVPLEVTLTTPEIDSGLKEDFFFEVAPPEAKHTSRPTERKERSSGFALPEIREVTREAWDNFEFDEDDVAQISKDPEKQTTESFVNMDNSSLLRFCFGHTQEAEVHKHQFKVASTIMALALETAVSAGSLDKADARTALRQIGKILLPVIESLGSIDE